MTKSEFASTACPKVSFIVPCYKLAHLLRECVNSILEQTFTDFEVLVMDDCSPDDTPAVAQSFSDPRVQHIRNDPNLGHLRNYNHGIELARGSYIWLISADDRLNHRDVLARYVDLLEANPSVGYVFCCANRLEDGMVKELLGYSVLGGSDRIINGRQFLKHLIYANTVVAPSAMARRECYERISMFPLDMPWGGDWYLWCKFALHYDVAYFSEPMVCYRRHSGSMTNQLMDGQVESCAREDIELPWAIKTEADALGYRGLVAQCRRAIAKEYARMMASERYTAAMPALSTGEFRQSLRDHTVGRLEYWAIERRAHAICGDLFYWRGDYVRAARSYRNALLHGNLSPKVVVQYAFLLTGRTGIRLRRVLGGIRRHAVREVGGA